jgi:KIF-1 binding protein C terminal
MDEIDQMMAEGPGIGYLKAWRRLNFHEGGSMEEGMHAYNMARILGYYGYTEYSAFYCLKSLNAQLSLSKREEGSILKECMDQLIEMTVYFINNCQFEIAEILILICLDMALDNKTTGLEPHVNRNLGRFYRVKLEYLSLLLNCGSKEKADKIWKSKTCPMSSSAVNNDYLLFGRFDVDGVAVEIAKASFVVPSDMGSLPIDENLKERAMSRFKRMHSGEKAGEAGKIHHEIFKLGLHFLNEAMKFYTLNDHASDHLSLVYELNLLWKELAEFEKFGKKKKMTILEKRIVLLDSMVFSFNSQIFNEFYMEFLYELGTLSSELFSLKAENEDAGFNAVRYFELYLNETTENMDDEAISKKFSCMLGISQVCMKLGKEMKQKALEFAEKANKFGKSQRIPGDQLKITEEAINLLRL